MNRPELTLISPQASRRPRHHLSLHARWLMQDVGSYGVPSIPVGPTMPIPFGTLRHSLPPLPKADGLTLTRWLRGTPPMSRRKRTSFSTGSSGNVKKKTSAGPHASQWRTQVAPNAVRARLKDPRHAPFNLAARLYYQSQRLPDPLPEEDQD